MWQENCSSNQMDSTSARASIVVNDGWIICIHQFKSKHLIQVSNDWSATEDLQLLQFVLKKGKKWARIAKKF